MSFDNSRFTFNPWNDYFGVVMQQGRVQLDSDWNEWLAEFARRIQAGTLDILGLAGVPSTTPDAFKIGIQPGGKEGKETKESLLEKLKETKESALEKDPSELPQVRPTLKPASSTATPTGTRGEVATRRAFISAQERPSVGKQALRTLVEDPLPVPRLPVLGPVEGLASTTAHITIGLGRIYVDGLLAENHGSVASAQWDAALAEWSGAPPDTASTGLVDYTQQPYLPQPPALPSGPFLVYLDVWQRDVGYLEDPDLVDQAVGVDTTGRLQTVWQVKLLPVSSGVYSSTRDSAIAPWESLIQPSPSLLTTGLVPSASSGSCSLSPATGYTGLENQLYRVQIHQSGAAATTPVSYPLPPGSGTATFKWSRENASVSTAVTAISSVTNSQQITASELTVQSMGRDQVLGFKPGDWIEIIDDYVELNIGGPPGELHQIDSINSAAKTITLDSTVTSANFPVNSAGQTDPTRHTRIQRWDQGGTVYLSDGATVWVDLNATGSTGDIPVPPSGTVLILESGITVAFDLNPPAQSSLATVWNTATTYTPAQIVTSGGNYYTCLVTNTGQAPPNPAFWGANWFQTGDFWPFAARTADGSVETFTQPVAAQSQLATAWNAAATYNPGQIVTSAGNYYTCSATNTNQAPPNASFWTATPAPPLGIRHHYCRLAMVDLEASPPVVDCRQLFPSLANPAIHITGISLGTGDALQSDSPITIQDLQTGINVACDVPVDPAVTTQPAAWNATTPYTTGQLVSSGGNYYICVGPNTDKDPTVAANDTFWAPALFNCPVCFVTVNLPVPATPPAGWYNPVILSAAVNVASTQISWTPSPAAVAALTNQFTTTGPPVPPLLAHLTLKGNSIWALDNPDVYLNGAMDGPGTTGGQQTPSLQSPSGDGRRSADFDMWFWLSPPGIALSTSTLDFGPTVVTTSATLSVVLTNNGATLLTISSVGTSGLNAGDFTTPALTGTTVASGASCTINVTFAPTVTGPETAQLNIAESVDSNPLVVSLTGVGTQAQVEASASELSFAAQTVGTPSPQQPVSLVNVGTAELTILSITPSGDFSQSSNLSAGITLQPGAPAFLILVTFTPTVAGERDGQLVITFNTPLSPLTIPLSGFGNKEKDTKETKDTKDTKDKDTKESKDKDTKEAKDKDTKETKDKDTKETKDKDTKEHKDTKEEKEVGEKAALLEKDKETPFPEVRPAGKPASSTDTPAEAGGEGAMRRAFISPEERPPVGKQALATPDDEPPKDGPKQE